MTDLGIYRLEGRKPGAAPVAASAWLGHQVIGSHKGGLVFLPGQSVLSSTKVTCIPGPCIVVVKKHFVARCMDAGQLLYVACSPQPRHPVPAVAERNGSRCVREKGG
ncbi:hypothetical protein DFH94DRAFT_107682 [Russula ochroleuca]|uniref:Uncharacterized protein n=1 Tax=Russula ochroleuca TaxID=152965 RepID=A0A9P5MRS9_9AGAM|nr:hypothetical protein DFH94DRAFT_107682 [Russula ochroleuca]